MQVQTSVNDGGGGGYSKTETEVQAPANENAVAIPAGIVREPNSHAYISRITQREENLIVEEYYSSTDIRIEFDGLDQTEIAYIQYAIQEQLKPLYGYASRTWDDVAVGNRIVTGMFKVPIRNPRTGYDSNNPGQEDFKTWYNGKGYKDEKAVEFGEEYQVEKNIPDWVGAATPGGSVPYHLKTEDGFSEEEWQTRQNLDVNHLYNGIYDRNGFPVKNPITGPVYITGSSYAYYPENADDFIYRQKLQELGYNLTNGSSVLTFEQQIAQFQKDMKIGVGNYGVLTSETKKTIDVECRKKWAESNTIFVKENSKLYSGPSIQTQVVVKLPKECEFVILSDSLTDSQGNTWQRIIARNETNAYYGYYCKALCEEDE